MENMNAILEKKSYMSLETELKIFKALEDWEKSHYFLNPACSIITAAREIGCNTKYLSYVVNKHMKVDFPNYVNQLRLEYLNNYLRTVPEGRNLKLSYLASICGFSSYGKFAKFVKEKTKYSPTQYIVFFDLL